MKKLLECAVILLGTMGWWGFVYPELCLLDVSYEYEEEYNSQEADEGEEDADAAVLSLEDTTQLPQKYEAVVVVPAGRTSDAATEKKVRIKSKIAEYVYQVRNRQAEKEIQDDE